MTPSIPVPDDAARPADGGVDAVLLARPRGFCAGVEMAIKALARMVQRFGAPVYCYHEIVHNRSVVERFEALGVVFVDSIDEVPAGMPVMLSAHGSAPEIVTAAREADRVVVNAACPLVTKVHHEVKVRAGKGYQIVYIGHAGHEEAVGTMAVAPDAIHLVEHADGVADLPDTGAPVAILAQTTLAQSDWAGVADAVRERFPDAWTPGRSDLCYATTNRQAAVRALAHRCDAVVVIGSANSSNTRALERVAREEGCARVLRIDGPDELPGDLAGTVGVAAGASAPESIVAAVLGALAPKEGIEEVSVIDEDEYFPLPRELRALLRDSALADAVDTDRQVDAEMLLTALEALTPRDMRNDDGEGRRTRRPLEPGVRATLLEGIERPADLRRLGTRGLERLAAEIRDKIVTSVSAAGGHLGSNLGAVELTLALHRSFDSPTDTILWDTGHQAYVHKMVTGRAAMFDTLRQGGGLSGYPSRAESVHDLVENSHASTILSYAHGLATARDARGGPGSRRHVVAVIGDGALTGGMAYEALNNLGADGTRVIIVLNDNGRSYAPTKSKLAHSIDAARAGGVGDLPGFFSDLGVAHIGPVDGHDIEALESAFAYAATHDGPIVVHARTVKGRGYEPAERDQVKCLHDTGTFDPATGQPRAAAGGAPAWTDVFSDTLCSLAQHRDDVVAITAAMPGSTGLLPFAQAHPERFFDVGIAEQHAVTMATGMALGGLRPVFAVYSTFFSRAFDQANLDAGLHGAPVTFVLDRAGITGDDGASHHGVLDMALCLRIPGMTIFAPSSAGELAENLRHALTLPGPCAIRFPKGTAIESPVTGVGLEARRVHGSGRGDVAVVGVGRMLTPALEAAAALEAAGTNVTVWDPRVVKPLDPAMVAELAEHPAVVVVEDGVAVGGAGSAIAHALDELAGRHAPPVRCLGVPDAYISHAKPADILAGLGLDGPGIARSLTAFLQD